jgi:hypothetical protein
MSKIYFSRSISRTMSADHPVGDPTGGAAYGEKNDPISAAISIASMAGTFSAAGSFAAMTVMQGITFAGAAMSLVGNVTGNKTLSKIGMIAGVAGGIGSLAEAKGWITKTPTLGETFGSTANTSALSATPTNQAPGNVSQADQLARNAEMADVEKNVAAARATGIETTGRGAQNANSYAGGSLTPSAADAVDDVAAGGFQKITNPAGAGQTGSDWQYFKDASGNSAAIDPSGRYFLNNEQVTGAAGGSFGVKDYANMAWEGTKNIASGLNPITNPYGAMAIGQIAAPISDYLSGKTDAEIAALEAQTGYADAKAMQMQEEIAREKQRRANLNAGYGQVNTGINVNPAVLGQAQAGGLISGAMQPAA